MTRFQRLCALALAGTALSAAAADWSDTSIGVRHGTKFREPYNPDDIAKTIVDLQHVSGYAYGSNFFNVDLLMSDRKDPASPGSSTGAQEAYVVYRHFLDAGKVFKTDFKAGPIRGWGLTAGFDWNTKNDAGYNSRKRMLVLGPTVSIDVPGFLNVGVHELWESNAPFNDFTQTGVSRYHYKAHPMLAASWGIPIGALPLSFEGYFDFIAAKGKDEFGNSTSPELNFDGQIMYDVGTPLGMGKNTFRVGLEYQYWRNKFGNRSTVPGSFAKTPMLRAEYHF